MKTPSRTVIEIAGVALAIIVVLCTWWWGDHERQAQLAEARARSDAELETMRTLARETKERLLMREAEGVLKAFSAGLHPLVMESRNDSIDAAVVDLIQLHEVVFAHVVTAEGVVIASSDRKLVAPEDVGERGRWALQATDLQARPGDADGTVELAMPLTASSGWYVIVWLGYNVGAAGEAATEP